MAKENITVDLKKLATELASRCTANSFMAGEGNVIYNSQFNHPVNIGGHANIFAKSKASGLSMSGKDNYVIDSTFISDQLGHLSNQEIEEALDAVSNPHEKENQLILFLKKIFPDYLKVGIQTPDGIIYTLELGKKSEDFQR